MASITVDVDIEDYLDEVDSTDLIDELKDRNYIIYNHKGVCVSDKKGTSLDKKMPVEYTIRRDFDRHKLRDHLLNLTGQGSYVSDDELLERIKELLIYG